MSGIPLNIDFQQVLFHLLNFVILFAILYFLLYKPVKSFMEKRRAQYEVIDKQTKENLDHSEKMESEYCLKLKNVDKEVAEIKNKAAKKAELEAQKTIEQAEMEAAEIIRKAQQTAEEEKNRIVAEAGKQISDLAKNAAEKAMFGSTSSAYDAFLDKVEEK